MHPSNQRVDAGPTVDLRFAYDGGQERRRLVLVPVDSTDDRTLVALEYAARIEAHDRRAVHVIVDDRRLRELGESWMTAGASWRLWTVDNSGGVPATLGQVVEDELGAGFEEVIVVVSRRAVGGSRRLRRRDRTSDAIGRVVSGIPGAITALMTVAAS
jgi:hypothetical protein